MSQIDEFSVVAIVIIAVFFGLVAYDVYLYAKKKPTLSDVIHQWGWYKPWIPFIVGFLCGHWFW
jgi:hypothetical protein